ncbi:hypothetical protein KXX19_006337, partial [Aspergillus fumigatus]
GCEPRDSNRDNPARHDNDDNDDGRDPGHRAAPTPEESEAARARLLEVYRNAQDAAIAELRQSDPTRAQQLALLQSVARGGDLTTPPPSQQGVIQASAAGAVEVSPESSPLSSAPPTAPQSPKSNSSRGSPFNFQSLSLPPPAQTPPEQPTAQKRKQRQPVEATAATDRPKRQRKAVRYKF